MDSQLTGAHRLLNASLVHRRILTVLLALALCAQIAHLYRLYCIWSAIAESKRSIGELIGAASLAVTYIAVLSLIAARGAEHLHGLEHPEMDAEPEVDAELVQLQRDLTELAFNVHRLRITAPRLIFGHFFAFGSAGLAILPWAATKHSADVYGVLTLVAAAFATAAYALLGRRTVDEHTFLTDAENVAAVARAVKANREAFGKGTP